jgi:hypothetical protein
MKNLVYFLVVVVTAFACSSDDGGTVIPPPVTMDFSAYINSGGPGLTVGGNDWEADDNGQNSDAAEVFVVNDLMQEIAGTENDTLYKTEVYDLDVFTYNIAVPGEATLDVSLHFAEIFHGVDNANGVGSRVFDVDVEGAQGVLTNYDIIAEAGAPATAIIETFDDIVVTDGNLTITFTTVQDAAKVNAVEVSGTYIVP